MLKAKARTKAGKEILIIGLSAENIRRLQAGEPLSFSLSEVAMGEGDCLVIAGGSEQDLAMRVSDMVHGQVQGQG